jgi:ribosomal protein S18 acetylase RimI-like enzyme
MPAQADVAIDPIPPDFSGWETLLALIRTAFAPMDGVIDPPSSVHRLTPEALRAKASAEVGFLARAGDTMIGCAFIAEQADHFYLGKLAVLPACQGRGVGRRLLEAAERHAVQAGKPLIELQTRVELTANHRAFKALGFVETGRTAHQGYDRPTSVTMRKRLA